VEESGRTYLADCHLRGIWSKERENLPLERGREGDSGAKLKSSRRGKLSPPPARTLLPPISCNQKNRGDSQREIVYILPRPQEKENLRKKREGVF